MAGASTSQLPRKGESVVAFGAPRGFSFTASEGIVSALRTGKEIAEEIDEYDKPDDLNWIQTTAPISAGNSGGPLVASTGEVIGVNTWTYTAGQNLNFAISSIEVREVLEASNGAQPTPLSKLPSGSGESGKEFGISDAGKIFSIFAQKDFEKAAYERISEIEEATTKLQAAYLSESVLQYEITAAEGRYDHAVEQLKNLSTYRPQLRKFLSGDNALIGYPGEWYVLQVLDEDSMLVQPHERSDEVFRLTGVSTAGIADDITHHFEGIWFAIGETYSYENTMGTQKTVYLIHGLDASPDDLFDEFNSKSVQPLIKQRLKSLKKPLAPTGKKFAELEEKRKSFAAARAIAEKERIEAEKAALRKREEELAREKAQKDETLASFLLEGSKRLLTTKPDVAHQRLRELANDYPETKSAAEARQMLGIEQLPIRTWTSGCFSVKGRLVSANVHAVTLELENGKEVVVMLDRLSSEDRDYVQAFRKGVGR